MVFQIVIGYCAIFLYDICALLILAVPNHSCLMFEELTIMAQSLKKNPKDNLSEFEDQLKEFIERSQVVLKRHEEAKKYLQFQFFVEFSLLSFMICFSLYANLIENTAASFVVLILSTIQLFIFCGIGKRVNDRIEKLETAIYDLEWYSANVKQQKAIHFVLMRIQITKGYDGIFNQVNMQTFLQVRKIENNLLNHQKLN